eukprot:284811_1
MIASVSTLAASSGTTRPVCLINFSAMVCSLFNVANVGEMSGHSSSGSHCRADQMRAPAAPISAPLPRSFFEEESAPIPAPTREPRPAPIADLPASRSPV